MWWQYHSEIPNEDTGVGNFKENLERKQAFVNNLPPVYRL